MVSYSDLKALGLSPQTATRWTQKGYLLSDNPTPGCGNTRLWLPGEDLIASRMIALIRDAGLPPAIAAKAARNNGWIAAEIRIVMGKAAARTAA